MRSRYLHAGPKVTGFTLIEVLVALLILSIGLLGLAMIQVRGMQYNNDSYFRTQATAAANEIIDRMRANLAGALAGNYVASGPPGTPQTCGDGTTGCTTTADIAAYDLSRWYQALSDRLPAPAAPTTIATIERTGTVETTADGTTTTFTDYVITIRWQERDLTITQVWEISI